MMLWALPLLPLLAGAALWAAGASRRPGAGRSRVALGAAAAVALAVTGGGAVWAAVARPSATSAAWEPVVALSARVDGVAGIVAVLVAFVALPIVVYAAAHEPPDGLARLLGLLVAFVGGMQLLVIADDLLTLLIGWELVGAISWALIGHEWQRPEAPAGATQAFLATRFGDLGLFAAAGATFAATGTFGYDALFALEGAPLHLATAGIVLAAVAKSAQLPFAPWLFSAMRGPTPVSALLHSAAMVAAGAYLLIRLEAALSRADWFAPTVIAIGLATAVAGGVVAAIQRELKRVLAASTSAQYGLMLIAVGAGSAAAATAHLVAHSLLKALLFLTAGAAISAAASEHLERMRLGSRLPVLAALAGVGTLALASVPPLGSAWTEEAVVAAAAHRATWLGALSAMTAGLTAFYAARAWLLAYGPGVHGEVKTAPGRPEQLSMGLLAVATLALGLLWLPAGHQALEGLIGQTVPPSRPWEFALTMSVVAAGLYGAYTLHRRRRLIGLGGRRAVEWMGLPQLARVTVAEPTLALSRTLARVDDQVVDAGVRGAAVVGGWLAVTTSARSEPRVDGVVRAAAGAGQRAGAGSQRLDDLALDRAVEALAAGVGQAGADSRRLQTGMTYQYYVVIIAGLAGLVAAAVVWT